MPAPHPGQQWRHGWIPVTTTAAKEKNHGRKPGAGSLLARVVAEAAASLNRMKAEDAERAAHNKQNQETSRQADAALRKSPDRPAPKRQPSGDRASRGGMRDAERHHTDAEGVNWANKHMPPPALTEEERSTLRAYTGRKYGPINKQLRAGHISDDQIQEYVDTLDGIFDKTGNSPPVVVHRGVDSDDGFADFLGADVDDPASMKALVGKDFREAGYMSTSVGRQAPFAGDIQLVIKVPEGYPVLNVMPESATGAREREILVRRDAHYVVHGAYKRGDYWHVEVEIVPDDWTPPPGWTPDPYGDADRQ